MDSNSRDILILLGELKGTMNALLTSQNTTNHRIDSHDKRIGALEKSKAWLLGGAFTVSALVGTLFHFLTQPK